MRTVILLAGLLIGANLEYIRNRPLTEKEEKLDAQFSKFYAYVILVAIAMDVIEFFTRVL